MKTNFSKPLLLLAAAPIVALAAGAGAQQTAQQDPSKSPKERGKMETRDQSGNVQAPDGLLRTQGSMMYLKNGQLSRVTYEMKLSEGLTARPNGEIVKPDGQTVTLQEGQMMTLDGQVTQAPKGLGSTAAGSSGTTAAETGAKTDFGNSGATGPQQPAAK